MSLPDPQQRSLLVVDDSFLMRRILCSIVERDPRLQVVGEAVDGADALEKVAALSPDVILLDVEMPTMDGIGFLRQARTRVTAPVIVISSVVKPGSSQAMEAIDLGAADILLKPSGVLSVDLDSVRGEELLDAIATVLGLPTLHDAGLSRPVAGGAGA